MTSWLRTTFGVLRTQGRSSLNGCNATKQMAVAKPILAAEKQPITLSTNATLSVCGFNLMHVRTYKSPREFEAPSPFKVPGPNRFGYRQKIYDGGPLPKMDKPLKYKPKFKAVDRWNRKRALFGQNYYIDILGDGTLHPADLISAPRYLQAFNGNEMQRLSRMMTYEGWRIRHLYPFRYHQIQKRIRFLNKKYNIRRGPKH